MEWKASTWLGRQGRHRIVGEGNFSVGSGQIVDRFGLRGGLPAATSGRGRLEGRTASCDVRRRDAERNLGAEASYVDGGWKEKRRRDTERERGRGKASVC